MVYYLGCRRWTELWRRLIRPRHVAVARNARREELGERQRERERLAARVERDRGVVTAGEHARHGLRGETAAAGLSEPRDGFGVRCQKEN